MNYLFAIAFCFVNTEFYFRENICLYSTSVVNKILEKGFQKKPIVAFSNSTVFILDFNI